MVAKRKNKSPKVKQIEEENKTETETELSLRQELEIENDFVQKLINSIPPKDYFSGEVLDYLEDQKFKATEETIKGFRPGRKASISTKGKQKRARLDPNQHKTVEQIQAELLAAKSPKKSKFSQSTNIEKLQEKLKNKIEQMQSVRNKHGVKKRQKNKHDKNKSTKKKKEFVKQIVANKSASTSPPITNGLKTKPIYNKEGKMVFSKFDLADGAGAGTSNMADKKKKVDKGNKALKKSLKKVQQEQEKLSKLKSQDPEKAQQVGDSKLWQKVLKKAEGEKVRDDPDKIKASLKKREKKKVKSKKGWVERTEMLNKKMQERQDKRQSNINKKKKDKKDKKMKQLKKKGRLLPAGF